MHFSKRDAPVAGGSSGSSVCEPELRMADLTVANMELIARVFKEFRKNSCVPGDDRISESFIKAGRQLLGVSTANVRPFSNCRYRICDLPGQCRDQGHCHHPASGERGADARPIAIEEAQEWISELMRAHVYLDQGKPFFSGKDCKKLAEFIESLLASRGTAPSVPDEMAETRLKRLCKALGVPMDDRLIADPEARFAIYGQLCRVAEKWKRDRATADHIGEANKKVSATAAPSVALTQALAEIERLNTIINTPHGDDFVRAVSIEAEHQRQHWGTEGDAGKTPADWFWLVGYLAGKALHAHASCDLDKSEHHVITTAAACANWHRNMFGKTSMRPGHEEGTGLFVGGIATAPAS